jgi:hypothetical protein
MRQLLLHSHRVSRLFVESFRVREDVLAVDLFGPRVGTNLLHRNRNGFVAVTQDACYILDDCIAEFVLLLVRLAGSEFDDYMRHGCTCILN